MPDRPEGVLLRPTRTSSASEVRSIGFHQRSCAGTGIGGRRSNPDRGTSRGTRLPDLADKLCKAGSRVEYENHEGVTHEFLGMAPVVKDADRAQTLVAKEFKAALTQH